MGHETVLVVSDLHLSAAREAPMCSRAGQERLAELVVWATTLAGSRPTTLILAGDIVDFLADSLDQAISFDEALVCRRLEEIVSVTEPIWVRLREYIAAGGKLTLLMGNHDPELSLPGARRVLRDHLKTGGFDFIYDGEAIALGDGAAGTPRILIEHGNAFDSWNDVPVERLNEARAAISRRSEKVPPPPFVAGSELVVRVINRIKKDYHFIDLLKPETSAAIPLLAVLRPDLLGELRRLVSAYAQTTGRSMGASWKASAGDPDPGADTAASRLALAEELLAVDGRPETWKTAAGPVQTMRALLEIWRAARSKHDKTAQARRLLAALRALSSDHDLAADLAREAPAYAAAAQRAFERGFTHVVLGHTHLAKEVAIGGGTYVNTGTWADLICLPETVRTWVSSGEGPPPDDVIDALIAFLEDMAENHLAGHRRLIPTFARFEMQDGGALDSRRSGLFTFLSPDKQVKTPPASTLWDLEVG